MNCRDFQEMIDSYLSDELLTETNHDVLRHMEDCTKCRRVIEARREVRSRLKNAVMNAPQYQIGKNFTHNLRVQLKHEALKGQEAKSTSRFGFGFGSWAAVGASLLLTFTLGFFFLGGVNETNLTGNSHIIPNLSPTHLTNIALGDHEYCAVGHNRNEPVTLAETPAKYENINSIVMPSLKKVISQCELIESHTCKYKGTDFTHLVLKDDNNLLSVMITSLRGAEKLKDRGILDLASDKYQIARFDLKDEAVFVISDFNKQTNLEAAQALYQPLQKHLYEAKYMNTSFLMFY